MYRAAAEVAEPAHPHIAPLALWRSTTGTTTSFVDSLLAAIVTESRADINSSTDWVVTCRGCFWQVRLECKSDHCHHGVDIDTWLEGKGRDMGCRTYAGPSV